MKQTTKKENASVDFGMLQEMSKDGGPKLQLTRELSGLSAEEQQKRLAPPRPIQMNLGGVPGSEQLVQRKASTAPVQMCGEGTENRTPLERAVLTGYDENTGNREKAQIVFDNFMEYCHSNDFRYSTKGANILGGAKSGACGSYSFALVTLFKKAGLADAAMYRFPLKHFITVEIDDDYVDTTALGNLTTPSKDVGDVRRYYFSEHHQVYCAGSIFDPTAGKVDTNLVAFAGPIEPNEVTVDNHRLKRDGELPNGNGKYLYWRYKSYKKGKSEPENLKDPNEPENLK